MHRASEPAASVTRSDAPIWARAFFASLVLHGALAWLVTRDLGVPEARQRPQVLTMRLIEAPRDSSPDVEQQPRAPAVPAEAADPESEPPPDRSATPGAEPVRTPGASIAPAPAADPARDRDHNLAARVLEQIARNAAAARNERPTSPAPAWPRAGAEAPGLPGTRGWLSGYVGSVRAESDTWRTGDGTTLGRHVLPDGTIVCTQRRAPTADEFNNPWKATIVTLAGVCGRAQPEPVHYDDLRVQPPPSAVRDGFIRPRDADTETAKRRGSRPNR